MVRRSMTIQVVDYRDSRIGFSRGPQDAFFWKCTRRLGWLPGRCGGAVCLGGGFPGGMPWWLAGKQVG